MEDIRENMKSFVRNYSLQTYNEDYNVKCDLSYKNYISVNGNREILKRLKNYLKSENIFCDGIFVTEFGSDMRNLQNHILMYCKNEKFYRIKSKIFVFWRKYGYSNIDQYNSSKNYSEYVCKYMNITNNRNWDFISSL